MRKIWLLPLWLGGLLALSSLAGAQVEYIIQYDDGNTVYYSGRPDPLDTCGVWFEPPTESQILSGLFQFNGGMGGWAQVYIWTLVPDFDPDNYYDTDEVAGVPGPRPIDSVLAGPIPYEFDNSGVFQEVVFADFGYPPEDLDVGTNNFFLGYVINEGNAQPFYPSILGDAADDRPYHSLCYLTTPGGVHPTEPGWWAYGIDWMLRCKVNMYGDPPPMISDLDDPPDTYTPGPYLISATITDQTTGGGPGQVTEARLIYSVMFGPETTVIMTHTTGDTYEGSIPAVNVGELINFRVEADDNAGHTMVYPVAGYNFTYLQPSGAHILLVNDGADVADQDFFTSSLQASAYLYDLWYISSGASNDQGYPGSDVINADIYSTVLWFTGTANLGSLPDNDANLTLDPVANYIDAGGNFFLTSSDYLGGAFNPDVWTEFTAIPGTFMYEYLHVAAGWSDAHLDPVSGESRDTVYYGVGGDPISGPYTTPFQDHPSPNYNDFCYPTGDATTCFYTQIDDEDAGIRYSGPYKMVFLPWILEAVDDTTISRGILVNILQWFGEVGVEPQYRPEIPKTYTLSQNFPNPFNPATQIQFALPHNSKVELSVYNVLNQEVARLVGRTMNAGTYTVTWDASKFTSGIYFYKLKADNFEQSRKMILVK